MLDEDQQKVVNAGDGFWAVYAGAGSGKTLSLVSRAARLSSLGKTLCLTFTSEAARNMRDRCAKMFPASTAEFRTVHSLALEFANQHPNCFPFPLSDNPLAGDGIAAKALFQATKNQINFKVISSWISLQKRNRVTPVVAVHFAERSGQDLANALAYREYQRLLKNQGCLDFDDLVTFMVSILETRPDIRSLWQYSYVLVDEAQDLSKIEWDLVRLLTSKHKNLMAIGDTGQCQPPGTMVQIFDRRDPVGKGRKCYTKQVPIELLSVGDKACTWYRRRAYTKIIGEKVLETSSRHYEGELLTIHSGGKQTRVTPNHQFWATIGKDCRFHYVTYMMYREGFGFRIGMCKTSIHNKRNNRNGVAGFSGRCYEERADMAWILGVWETREEAHWYELVTASKFGIPTSVYCANDRCKVTQELINAIFSVAPLQRGLDCLEEHHKFFDLPLFHRTEGRPHMRYFKVAACNLIPELMKIPAVGNCQSEFIDKITREDYSGPVHSLDIDKDHTYIADGIVVCNSIYGFRGGIAEHFLNMEEYFLGTKKLFLGKNYRSSKKIVEYVRQATPQQELAEHLEAMSKEEGVEPNVTGYSTDFREAEGVVEKIKKLVPGECAVLARTNLSLRPIEECLIEKNVPYYILNEDGYWDLEEIRNVMSWVRCVQSPVDNFVLSALQTPFHPTQYIKRKLVAQEIRDQITRTGKSAWKLLSEYRGKDDRQTQAVRKFTDFIQRLYAYRSLPAREVVSKVIKDLGCLEYYREESGISPDKDPVASIRELVRISEKHDSLQDFLNYVRKVAGASRNRKGVVLSTVHSFKGREAANVFFISCNANMFPHSKSEDEMSDRCAWYVGLSRAEKILEISYWGAPSPYIRLTQEIKCDSIDVEVKECE